MQGRQVEFKNSQTLDILEQEFRKARSRVISWDQLLKNKKIKDFFSHYDLFIVKDKHIKIIRDAFCKSVDLIPAYFINDSDEKVKKYFYSENKTEFERRNQFQSILNQQTLFSFIEKHPKGVLVSDELLDFTYRDIQKDIEKALAENQIKKLNSSKTKKEYYVFPNTIESEYGFKGDRHRYFGQQYFLGLCKDSYKDFSMLKEDQNISTGTTNTVSLIANQRFNEQWVPGYIELKKQWLLKNQEKQKHRQSKH